MKKCRVVFDTNEVTRDFIKSRKESVKALFREGSITQRPITIGDSNTYSYLCPFDDLTPGDLVVVEAKNGIALATFVTYDPLVPKGLTLKYVVSHVDTSFYENMKEKERKRAELFERMNERKKELEDITLFKMLAESDPEMKKMLDELNGID